MRKLQQKRVQKGEEAKKHYKYYKLENGGFVKIENGAMKAASFSEINDLNKGKLPFSTDVPTKEMEQWKISQGCSFSFIASLIIFILIIISLLSSN